MSLVTNSKVEFSIIAVTETWLNETNQDIFQIAGYKFIPLNRIGSKKGGGVGLYVKNCFDVVVKVDMCSSTENMECLIIEASQLVKKRTLTFTVGCIYRPPNGNMLQFNTKFSELLSAINPKRKKSKDNVSILAGDFNIDLIRSQPNKCAD
jgi:exonuclease III